MADIMDHDMGLSLEEEDGPQPQTSPAEGMPTSARDAAEALFSDPDFNPGGTFTAQVGLLSSLAAERDFHKRQEAGKDMKQVTILKAEDGSTLPVSTLHQFRTDYEAEAIRVTQAELDEVKSLHHLSLPFEPSSTGYGKVRGLADKRKSRHDAEVSAFQEERKALYEEIEVKVLQVGTQVKEELQALDDKLAAVFHEMRDEVLVEQQEPYVHDRWREIEGLCRQRSARITKFAGELEALECQRAELVGSRLKKLVRDLVSIAQLLPPAIERLAEGEAYEVNLILINNRKDHADVVARLRKVDVKNFHLCRARWERRFVAWRKLKHDRALHLFQERINSDVYVNPPARKSVIDKWKSDRIRRHEQARLPALLGLKSQYAPNFSSAGVKAAHEALQQINTEEEGDNKTRFDQLGELQTKFNKDARQELEQLRAELHSYGALSEEGDFKRLLQELVGFLHGEDMEAFLIRAGGIKLDLGAIQTSLGLSTLIYQDDLEALKNRTEFLISGFGLDKLLDEQGKAGDRKALQQTLEQMRVARKGDLPALLPTLHKQVSVLAGVTGLQDRCRNELNSALDSLNELMSEMRAFGTVGGSKGPRSRVASVKSGGAKSSVAGRSRRGSASSIASSTGGGGMADMLNVGEVRSVQRKVGSLMYVCELPAGLQAVLQEILRACNLQEKANQIIDRVVRTDCVPLVEKRDAEGRALLRRIAMALEKQSLHIHLCIERIIDFYTIMATTAEKNKASEADTDSNMQDALNGILDDYEDADANREKELERALLRLRRAPDDVALERLMAAAMHCLDDIEEGYRDFYKQSVGVSRKHPVAVDDNLRSYRHHLCQSFHLVFPRAEEVDGLSDEALRAREAAATNAKAEAEAAAAAKAAAEEAARVAAEEARKAAEAAAAAAAKGKKGAPTPRQADPTPRETSPRPEPTPREEEAPAPAPVEEPPVADWEKLPELSTHAGTSYRVSKSTARMAFELLADSDEEEEAEGQHSSARRESVPRRSSTASVAAAGAAAGAPAEPHADGADAPAAAAEPAPPRDFDENGLPIDPHGNTCVTVVKLPSDVLTDMLQSMLVNTLEYWDGYSNERRQEMAALRDQRVSEFTEQLEERLRRHWPRKGHAEVKVKQPREAELVSHRQRQVRHARNILSRNEAHGRQFDDIMVAARAEIQEFVKTQDALARALPSRTNLAALQGVLAKVKRLRADFKEAGDAVLTKLAPFTHDEPQRLLAANEEFLRSCKLFSQGGEYATEEVAQSKKALRDVEERIAADLKSRQDTVDELRKNQEEVLATITQVQQQFDDCLQDLSMREGLGQKYGGPRRFAQERIRTEIAWSNAAAAAISDKLDELARLLEAAPGAPAPAGGVLAVNVCTVIAWLRESMYKRAKFLQAFKEGVRTFDLTPVVLDDAAPKSGVITYDNDAGKSAEEKAAEAREAARTLTLAVQEMRVSCEKQTRDLYRAEGKPLPDGEIPASLSTYLQAKAEEAEEHRLEACHKLREQVERFQELLLEAPIVTLRDVTVRCMKAVDTAQTAGVAQFESQLAAFELVKAKHKSELTPQLADPNRAAERNKLCDREKARLADARACIIAAAVKLQKIAVEHSGQFTVQLEFYVAKLLRLLDNTIIRTDLGPLPGDENLMPERMSLKKLKKNLRKREKEAADAAGGTPATGAPTPAAAAAAATPAAATTQELGPSSKVLRPRTWQGLPLGQFQLPARPDWLAGSAAELDSKKQEGFAPSLNSFYTPATRHVIRTRDTSFDEYKMHFVSSTTAAVQRCGTVWTDEATWEANWNTLVSALSREQADV